MRKSLVEHYLACLNGLYRDMHPEYVNGYGANEDGIYSAYKLDCAYGGYELCFVENGTTSSRPIIEGHDSLNSAYCIIRGIIEGLENS